MEKKQSKIIIGSAVALAVVLAAGAVSYSVGKNKYTGKFLPNTRINGLNVAGLSVEDSISKIYKHSIENIIVGTIKILTRIIPSILFNNTIKGISLTNKEA